MYETSLSEDYLQQSERRNTVSDTLDDSDDDSLDVTYHCPPPSTAVYHICPPTIYEGVEEWSEPLQQAPHEPHAAAQLKGVAQTLAQDAAVFDDSATSQTRRTTSPGTTSRDDPSSSGDEETRAAHKRRDWFQRVTQSGAYNVFVTALLECVGESTQVHCTMKRQKSRHGDMYHLSVVYPRSQRATCVLAAKYTISDGGVAHYAFFPLAELPDNFLKPSKQELVCAAQPIATLHATSCGVSHRFYILPKAFRHSTSTLSYQRACFAHGKAPVLNSVMHASNAPEGSSSKASRGHEKVRQGVFVLSRPPHKPDACRLENVLECAKVAEMLASSGSGTGSRSSDRGKHTDVHVLQSCHPLSPCAATTKVLLRGARDYKSSVKTCVLLDDANEPVLTFYRRRKRHKREADFVLNVGAPLSITQALAMAIVCCSKAPRRRLFSPT